MHCPCCLNFPFASCIHVESTAGTYHSREAWMSLQCCRRLTVMMSEMPLTPCRKMSSAALKASVTGMSASTAASLYPVTSSLKEQQYMRIPLFQANKCARWPLAKDQAGRAMTLRVSQEFVQTCYMFLISHQCFYSSTLHIPALFRAKIGGSQAAHFQGACRWGL